MPKYQHQSHARLLVCICANTRLVSTLFARSICPAASLAYGCFRWCVAIRVHDTARLGCMEHTWMSLLVEFERSAVLLFGCTLEQKPLEHNHYKVLRNCGKTNRTTFFKCKADFKINERECSLADKFHVCQLEQHEATVKLQIFLNGVPSQAIFSLRSTMVSRPDVDSRLR